MTPVMRSTDELRTREEIPRIIIDIINAPVAAAAVIPIADPVVNPATADAMVKQLEAKLKEEENQQIVSDVASYNLSPEQSKLVPGEDPPHT